MPYRIRVSRAIIRYRIRLSVALIAAGAFMLVLPVGGGNLLVVGIALLLAGGFGLLFNMHISKHASHPWVTGYEIERDKRRPVRNFARQLRELKQLKDDGVISQEEFAAKKADILSRKW